MVVIETFKILRGIGPIYMKGFVTEMQTLCHFRCIRLPDVPRTLTERYGANSVKNLAATTWEFPA